MSTLRLMEFTKSGVSCEGITAEETEGRMNNNKNSNALYLKNCSRYTYMHTECIKAGGRVYERQQHNSRKWPEDDAVELSYNI